MRRLIKLVLFGAAAIFAASVARAADLQVPATVTAGTQLSIPTSGSGDATFYLVGPGSALKQTVHLGETIKVSPSDLQYSGPYIAVLNGATTKFVVTPAKPADIAFLARPSRVPASRKDVISGTAFVFDADKNLVLDPTPVKFDLGVAGGRTESRRVTSEDGVAYSMFDSGKLAGAAQFIASVQGTDVRRVVQQVASDPCNLRMKAQPSKNGIAVETDPVRDCSGNAVPDGTIVTFTEMDRSGRSTIDARIKKGVARAEFPPAQNATLSVAAGVVVGNEIHWGGAR